MRRTLVAVVAVVLGYAVMAGLFPRRLAAQPPSFRAGVEVVAIDVSVVDRVGFPVGDLQPADFTVTVDGRPRKIVSAQFLSHRAPGIDEIARAERGEPLPEVVAPGRIGTERDVIIAVDEDSLAAGDGQLAKRAIGRFVNQLMPADRIAIVTLPRLPGRIGLTSDRRDVFDALSLISPGLMPAFRSDYQIGLTEAYEIARQDGVTAQAVVQRECIDKLATTTARSGTGQSLAIESCRTDVLLQANQMVLMGRDRAQRSLDALHRLADLLSSIPRPKTLVVVSGGFPPPISQTEFAPVAQALASAQVNLYTLYLEKLDMDIAAPMPSPTASSDRALVGAGIENVTGAAGGTLLRVTGEFEPMLDRVSRELSGSYLLGVSVEAADRDGRPHRVGVHVNRDGVTVRARTQYVIGTAAAAAAPAAPPPEETAPTDQPLRTGPAAGFTELSHSRILTAARDLADKGDVYITLKASLAEAKGSAGREVLVQAKIDPRSVSFAPTGGRRVAHLGIGVFCGDAKHAVVGQLWQEVNLALKDDTFTRYSGEGIPYTARVPVTGDPRDVKIIVYDFRSDLLGAMTTRVK